MRLPRKVTYGLLLSLLCLNYLIRYPQSGHEFGPDAFVFHGMTLTLVQFGYAKWILHPLSYLGLYPLGHPSGSLFALGSLSVTSGLTIEGSILLYDMALVAFGLLAAFVMSMEIRRDEGLALLVAALFSLSPRFVTSLLWEVPTRAMFAAMVPMFVTALLRAHRTKDLRWAFLVGAVLFLMMSAHRLTVLMAVIILAFVLTAILLVVAHTLRIRYASRVLSRGFRRTVSAALLVAFFGVTAGLIVLGGVLASYEAGRISIGSGVVLEATNLAVSLATSAGILVAFVPLGAIAVYQSRAKGFKEPFLLMVLLVLVPTLSLRQYTGYYIITFTALFAGMGVWFLAQRMRSGKVKAGIVAVAITASLVASNVLVGLTLNSDSALRDDSYVTGLYIRYGTNGTIIANDGRTGSEVFAVSGHPYLPVGGATTAFQSPELLIFDFTDRSALLIVRVPLQDLTIEADSPFQLVGVNAEFDWSEILATPRDSVSPRVWNRYQPQYLLDAWEAGGGFLAYGQRYPSPFVQSVRATCYRVFEASGQTLWFVGGPP